MAPLGRSRSGSIGAVRDNYLQALWFFFSATSTLLSAYPLPGPHSGLDCFSPDAPPSGIVNTLGRDADDLKIRVILEATKQEGFSQTVLEDSVKETLFNLVRTDEALKTEE